ncbi:hypothetical protein AB0L40_26790 [Patulibacter sp. NPDC049589]|uniref:hypothetical protein n=1 Tax=Patulibacter sp. NPDC049589 TaxID=3154731 RepID=UPI003415C972
MTTPRCGITMNGRITMELKSRPGGRTAEQQLRAGLELMDGEDDFAFLLWHLPEGVPRDSFDLELGPDNYIQCAGGLDGRFTCEIRRVTSDGTIRHEVLGRASGPDSEPWVRIKWSENETSVRQSEVFDRDEVIRLFETYRSNGSIPDGYVTRRIEV